MVSHIKFFWDMVPFGLAILPVGSVMFQPPNWQSVPKGCRKTWRPTLGRCSGCCTEVTSVRFQCHFIHTHTHHYACESRVSCFHLSHCNDSHHTLSKKTNTNVEPRKKRNVSTRIQETMQNKPLFAGLAAMRSPASVVSPSSGSSGRVFRQKTPCGECQWVGASASLGWPDYYQGCSPCCLGGWFSLSVPVRGCWVPFEIVEVFVAATSAWLVISWRMRPQRVQSRDQDCQRTRLSRVLGG